MGLLVCDWYGGLDVGCGERWVGGVVSRRDIFI